MRVFLGIIVGIALAVLGVIAVAALGRIDVSADRAPGGALSWLADTAMRNSVRAQAKGIAAPDLSDPVMVEEGAKRYRDNCEACHGGPGAEPGAIGRALMPRPADLARSAGDWSPAELFWIVRHGLRGSGMPSFGAILVEAEVWPVVAFTAQLPTLSAERYRALVEPPQPEAPADAQPEAPMPLPQEGEPLAPAPPEQVAPPAPVPSPSPVPGPAPAPEQR